MFDWYAKLQKQFLFDPTGLAVNVRRSEARWARRLAFLEDEQLELHAYVMNMIREGHVSRTLFVRESNRLFLLP